MKPYLEERKATLASTYAATTLDALVVMNGRLAAGQELDTIIHEIESAASRFINPL